MNRVYISGKITGLKDYMKIFADAEMDLLNMGYDSIVNPAAVCSMLPSDLSHGEYLAVCLNGMLPLCNAIYMISNWKYSKGAKEELVWAIEHGLDVIYQGE